MHHTVSHVVGGVSKVAYKHSRMPCFSPGRSVLYLFAAQAEEFKRTAQASRHKTPVYRAYVEVDHPSAQIYGLGLSFERMK